MTKECDGLEERVGELESLVADLQGGAKAAFQKAKSAEQEADDLRDDYDALVEELEEVRAENETLKNELAEVRERTDLLQAVRQASALDSEEQAAVCIQNLVNKASSGDGRASLTPSEGLSALGHSIDRTSIYDVFRRAERLVGDDDVLWYKSESRSSQKNSRLILDADGGDVPSTVAGHDVTPQDGCGTSTTQTVGVGGSEKQPATD